MMLKRAQRAGAAELSTWLQFSDGAVGVVDLTGELHGMMFEPLSNTSMFASALIDDELGAVAWDNAADLAPEFLHARVKVRPRARLGG